MVFPDVQDRLCLLILVGALICDLDALTAMHHWILWLTCSSSRKMVLVIISIAVSIRYGGETVFVSFFKHAEVK